MLQYTHLEENDVCRLTFESFKNNKKKLICMRHSITTLMNDLYHNNKTINKCK